MAVGWWLHEDVHGVRDTDPPLLADVGRLDVLPLLPCDDGAVMKIRTGRKNPHTLYLQLGDDPSDDDLRIGFMIDPQEASLLAEASETMRRWNLNEIRISAEIRIEDGR